MKNNNETNNNKPAKAHIREVKPVIPEGAQPLSRLQHIINGVAIIVVLLILTIAAFAVISWMNREETKPSESTGGSINQDSLPETEGLSDINPDSLTGDPYQVLPQSLARGNNIIVGLDDAVEIVNPLYASSDGEQDLVSLIFETLLVIDDSGRPQGHLAAKWDYSQEIGVLTFTLDQGHFFRDGRSVQAADVIFTYNCLRDDSYNGPYKGRFANISSVVQGDTENTVLFEFKDPPVSIDYSLFTIGILKSDHYEQYANRVYAMFDEAISPEGSGSFEISQFDDETIEIKLRKGYAGNMVSIIFKRIDAADKYTMLLQGQLDIVRNVWDTRLKIRTKNLKGYSFYPLESKIESFVMTSSGIEHDSFTSQEQQTAVLLALAGYDLSQQHIQTLNNLDEPIKWYYFQGVDGQTEEANRNEVLALSEGLQEYGVSIAPEPADWPKLAAMLDSGEYDLILMPAPANNRLPGNTVLLSSEQDAEYPANINAWPCRYSSEAIIASARLQYLTINRNQFPLTASTAGWTGRPENIRFYDPNKTGGDVDE